MGKIDNAAELSAIARAVQPTCAPLRRPSGHHRGGLWRPRHDSNAQPDG